MEYAYAALAHSINTCECVYNRFMSSSHKLHNVDTVVTAVVAATAAAEYRAFKALTLTRKLHNTYTVLLVVRRYCCLQIVVRFISVYIFFSLALVFSSPLQICFFFRSTLFEDHYFFFCFVLVLLRTAFKNRFIRFI